jgi:hypothetical protein
MFSCGDHESASEWAAYVMRDHLEVWMKPLVRQSMHILLFIRLLFCLLDCIAWFGFGWLGLIGWFIVLPRRKEERRDHENASEWWVGMKPKKKTHASR